MIWTWLTTVYFLMKIDEHHYNYLLTKLTLCINQKYNCTSCYLLKKNFKDSIKTCYTITHMSSLHRLRGSGVGPVQNPDLWIPVHGLCSTWSSQKYFPISHTGQQPEWNCWLAWRQATSDFVRQYHSCDWTLNNPDVRKECTVGYTY